MAVAATKKNIVSALEQMHLYGAIQRWAEPVGESKLWTVWTGESSRLTYLTGREVLAMNTGVCAAFSALYDGRSVKDKGMFLRADLAARRGSWDGGKYVAPAVSPGSA